MAKVIQHFHFINTILGTLHLRVGPANQSIIEAYGSSDNPETTSVYRAFFVLRRWLCQFAFLISIVYTQQNEAYLLMDMRLETPYTRDKTIV